MKICLNCGEKFKSSEWKCPSCSFRPVLVSGRVNQKMQDEKSSCPELSVVIPCYNSEKLILELHQRLTKALDSLQVAYEIIYVNDDSADHTGSILKQIALENINVIAVDLMYNSGQFKALLCGLELSRGTYIVTMDDDLQHPPEEIYKLYNKIKENEQLDVVIGRYLKKNHSLFRNLGSLFIQILSGNQRTDIKMTSFRCLSRNVVEVILMHKTMSPFIGSIIRKSTSRIVNVDVEHHARRQGKSNYSLKKLTATGIDRIFHYTSAPLKLVSISGIIISLGSFAAALYYFIVYLKGHISLPGWTTIVLLINFYSGLIILSIGIIGEYLIRILSEVSGSPRYYIRNIYRRQDQFANPEG